MGYNTHFTGSFRVDPPLNETERNYLRGFTAHKQRGDQPFKSPPGHPGRRGSWIANADGTAIEWDGVEKFYRASGWIEYLISELLGPDAELKSELTNPTRRRRHPAALAQFTFDHVVDGEVRAEGQDGAVWLIKVVDNVVTTIEVRGRAPVEYAVFIMPRGEFQDLDREFDAAFDLCEYEQPRVEAGTDVAAIVRRRAEVVHPALRADKDGDLVDSTIGLRISVEADAIRIGLGAEEAFPDANRTFALVQRLAGAVALELGWIAYDPAQRVAVRPGSEFRRRAIEVIDGYRAEPDGQWAQAVI